MKEQPFSMDKKEYGTIDIFVFDDLKGDSKTSISEFDFPKSAMNNVVDGKVYMHCTYVNNKANNKFISKTEYDTLVKSSGKVNIPENQNKINCIFCSKAVNESDVFCPYCGRRIKNIKKCVKCGEFNDMTNNFCYKCGEKM